MAFVDHVERPGTLTLRGNAMNYSRGILNSNWNQAREAEPKDYVISTDPVRNLKRATYDRLASITDGSHQTLPNTTYQAHCDQTNLREDYLEREDRKSMVNTGTFHHLALENRETGCPEKGFNSVLPHHHPDHDKFRSNTTYGSDFDAPFPYESTPEKPVVEEAPDNTVAYKRCHSQFSDTADYRRPGRNTWQDESGVYANSMHKMGVYKSTKDTIPSRLV